MHYRARVDEKSEKKRGIKGNVRTTCQSPVRLNETYRARYTKAEWFHLILIRLHLAQTSTSLYPSDFLRQDKSRYNCIDEVH
jgi:hypothetical protein